MKFLDLGVETDIAKLMQINCGRTHPATADLLYWVKHMLLLEILLGKAQASAGSGKKK